MDPNKRALIVSYVMLGLVIVGGIILGLVFGGVFNPSPVSTAGVEYSATPNKGYPDYGDISIPPGKGLDTYPPCSAEFGPPCET